MTQILIKTEEYDPWRSLSVSKITKNRITLNRRVLIIFKDMGLRRGKTIKVELSSDIHRHLTIIFESITELPIKIPEIIKFNVLKNYPIESYLVSISYLKYKNREFIPVFELEFPHDLFEVC